MRQSGFAVCAAGTEAEHNEWRCLNTDNVTQAPIHGFVLFRAGIRVVQLSSMATESQGEKQV